MRRVRPHRLVVVVHVVAVASGLAACDLEESEDCPSGALEVRPFDGPPVTENLLECSGLPCSPAAGDILVSRTHEGCGRLAVTFGVQSAFSGHYFDVYLDPFSRTATAWFETTSDVGDPDLHEVLGGWIAVQQRDDDDLVGRFEIEVESGRVGRGDFDTRIDPFE